VYAPVVVFAVNVDDVATPVELVVSVSVAVPLAKVPLAPLLGAVNVTDTPLTGLPLLFVTVADSAVPKAAPTVALCVAPAVAAMAAGVVDPDPEFELLLQLVRKVTTAKATKTSTLN